MTNQATANSTFKKIEQIDQPIHTHQQILHPLPTQESSALGKCKDLITVVL